jgi:hypothetical protein
MERTLKRTPENNGEGYPPTPHPGNGHQTNEKGKTVPLSQAERDKKRLAELKKSGGGNVLLRLHRQEVAALNFLAKYHDMDRGRLMAYLLTEESSRVSSLLLSNPGKLRKYIEKE